MESTIDTGDTTWILISAALVMLMTPGVGFFYGGLVRSKNALATIMHSFGILQNCRKGDLTVTRKAAREIVSLPLHSCMAPEARERVADAVVGFFDRARGTTPGSASLRRAG